MLNFFYDFYVTFIKLTLKNQRNYFFLKSLKMSSMLQAKIKKWKLFQCDKLWFSSSFHLSCFYNSVKNCHLAVNLPLEMLHKYKKFHHLCEKKVFLIAFRGFLYPILRTQQIINTFMSENALSFLHKFQKFMMFDFRLIYDC